MSRFSCTNKFLTQLYNKIKYNKTSLGARFKFTCHPTTQYNLIYKGVKSVLP